MNRVAPIKDERKLQEFCDKLKSIDEKYYIMFRIGIGTGLQIQEILRLRVGEVRDKDYFSASIGMRNIRRDFRIPAELKAEISAFTEGKEDSQYLICGHRTRTDTPISREQAYRVLKEAGRSVGLSDVGAVTMRKTFAWRYYQRTGDIYYLQNLLGHNSPIVTCRYIDIVPGLEIGIRSSSPGENASARARLFQGGSGAAHIESLRRELLKIENEMKDPRHPDAWFGKTESLLHSIDLLLDEYKNG